MKMTTKVLSLGVLSLSLTGCVTLDQMTKDVQKATAPTMLTESTQQICQAAKDNQVRANSMYANKGLSVTGEVRSITEGFQPRYRVFLRAGQVSVHAGTGNKASIAQLAAGNTVRVTGVVTDVSYDFNGCAISLKDAAF